MDPRKVVFQETGVVALGVSLCAAVMVGVFALMGLFDLSVVLGALVGTVLTVANFFVMAICASLAADKAAAQDVAGAKALLSWSQTGRYVVLGLLLFACGTSGFFNLFALVLPLVFVQPTITIAEFFRKSGEKKS
ncbi:MAG: hypothetical protein IKC09_08070 [Oscillospiraceae bacterium]|nr:hypothetical protein [Oscillospiraceae bacterium]